MAIQGRWRSLDKLPAKRGRDAMPGVYELADEARVLIYIGQSAKDVPNRIRQHLAKPGCLQDKVCYWRYAYSRVPQADEAALIDKYLERHGDLPSCNRATPRKRSATKRYLERSRSDT
ncbi:MAG: GIY-YIG nuclease family protein [Deinococcota bacterium]